MAWGYDRGYFIDRQPGWDASAAALVAELRCLFELASAVEIGCGTGNLLAAFVRHGVADVLGLVGPDTPEELMCLPPAQRRAWDLDLLAPLDRRFDIACSLEVAEHVAPADAERFVAMLVAAAPVVVFGAAIPGQGGPGHVNERRQSWWAARFARHGYVAVDCIRSALWGTPGLEWYYAQNVLVYCLPRLVPAGHAPVTCPLYLDLVDERVMAPLLRGPDSIKGAVQALRRDLRALRQALARRARRAA